MKATRRDVLLGAGTSSAVLFAAPALAATAEPACPDPKNPPPAIAAQRRGLNYVEPSTNPKKRCGLCFWWTATSGGCGKCGLMGGNPTSMNGVCSSFAPRKE